MHARVRHVRVDCCGQRFHFGKILSLLEISGIFKAVRAILLSRNCFGPRAPSGVPQPAPEAGLDAALLEGKGDANKKASVRKRPCSGPCFSSEKSVSVQAGRVRSLPDHLLRRSREQAAARQGRAVGPRTSAALLRPSEADLIGLEVCTKVPEGSLPLMGLRPLRREESRRMQHKVPSIRFLGGGARSSHHLASARCDLQEPAAVPAKPPGPAPAAKAEFELLVLRFLRLALHDCARLQHTKAEPSPHLQTTWGGCW